jgi:hypothetical protein
MIGEDDNIGQEIFTFSMEFIKKIKNSRNLEKKEFLRILQKFRDF